MCPDPLNLDMKPKSIQGTNLQYLLTRACAIDSADLYLTAAMARDYFIVQVSIHSHNWLLNPPIWRHLHEIMRPFFLTKPEWIKKFCKRLDAKKAMYLLQALYYFSYLVVQGLETGKQQLEASPMQAEISMKSDPNERGDTESYTVTDVFESESGSNYSTQESSNKRIKTASLQYNLKLDSLRYSTYVGEGATGQVIRLKDSDIVVKCCDSYNNPEGWWIYLGG